MAMLMTRTLSVIFVVLLCIAGFGIVYEHPWCTTGVPPDVRLDPDVLRHTCGGKAGLMAIAAVVIIPTALLLVAAKAWGD